MYIHCLLIRIHKGIENPQQFNFSLSHQGILRIVLDQRLAIDFWVLTAFFGVINGKCIHFSSMSAHRGVHGRYSSHAIVWASWRSCAINWLWPLSCHTLHSKHSVLLIWSRFLDYFSASFEQIIGWLAHTQWFWFLYLISLRLCLNRLNWAFWYSQLLDTWFLLLLCRRYLFWCLRCFICACIASIFHVLRLIMHLFTWF